MQNILRERCLRATARNAPRKTSNSYRACCPQRSQRTLRKHHRLPVVVRENPSSSSTATSQQTAKKEPGVMPIATWQMTL